ncbi:Hydrogenase-4 component B [anaerobic digester metagenome]
MHIFLIFCFVLLASIGVFFLPLRIKHVWTLVVALASVILACIPAVDVLVSGEDFLISGVDMARAKGPLLIVDELSAFFILIISFTWLTGLIYAHGYLRSYYETKSPMQISLHLFAYLWLGFAMIMVAVAQDFLSFLIVWELMTLSSFILVIFDAEDRTVLKSGINYLIQMHVGLLFLIAAMLIVNTVSSVDEFRLLGAYFAGHSNFVLFLLFFIGFGIKAGFVPFHTWLPKAHPAAPSHVSGVMSGVMIKMGIYGILRVLLSVESDLMNIGLLILGVSLLSGILGILQAIVQNDIKKLLAYSSIENIGIIGIGIGLGVIGLATENTVLTLLGFSGALLHILNHSLFKSMLFFAAGAVYKSTHTRNINQLGGLIKKMPYTGMFFIIASAAICGLPPLNGFISEYLIYSGIISSLGTASFYQSLIFILSIIALALIGGLALFAFTKATGVIFLGEARSEKVCHAKESPKSMLWPLAIISVVIFIIGLVPLIFAAPLFSMVSQWFDVAGGGAVSSVFVVNLQDISIVCGVFVLLSILLLVWRRLHLKNKPTETGPTWGCGYTAPTASLQYTATSYADNIAGLAQPVLRMQKQSPAIDENDLFPEPATFETTPRDIIQEKWIDKPTGIVAEWLKKMARMQTGRIEHYILYAFAFMILIFILTYFNLL